MITMRFSTLLLIGFCMSRHLSVAVESINSNPAVPSDTRNPVVLVHGIKDDARKMERMARHLRDEGWTAYTLSLTPSWGQVGLDELAGQLAAFTDRTFSEGEKFDLVAFSMGGLVARYYLQRLGGIDRVERFVTLSSPHHGTWFAHLLPNAGGRQMRPRSEFLRDLNHDAEMLSRVQVTSIWTPLDLIILPPRSSRLSVGREQIIWMPAHPLMVWHRACHRAVAAALKL